MEEIRNHFISKNDKGRKQCKVSQLQENYNKQTTKGQNSAIKQSVSGIWFRKQ